MSNLSVQKRFYVYNHEINKLSLQRFWFVYHQENVIHSQSGMMTTKQVKSRDSGMFIIMNKLNLEILACLSPRKRYP